MGQLAIVFSGQGAQAVGMGRSLYESNAAAKAVFDRVEALRPGTLSQCFEGDEATLMRTLNTQPCLWAVEMAAAAALTEAGVSFQHAAGFSIGEMAALTFAKVVDFETGFALVNKRAALMDEASQKLEAAMGAVMKLDAPTLEALCQKHEQLWPVNYNCPGQITVAGSRASLEALGPEVKAAGGLLKILKVGGAFHSPLMNEAAAQFAEVLRHASLQKPALTLYANATGQAYGADVTETLSMQMNHPVHWQRICEAMAAQGVTTFVEVGPGATLCGLLKRTLPEATTLAVNDADSLLAALERIAHER